MEKKLNQDWIIEGLLDFEYKKYILLAYLQYVESHFSEAKLYPPFADLLSHYRNLVSLKNEKSLIDQAFPKLVNGIDQGKLDLTYERLIQDDKALAVVSEIVEFALPQFLTAIDKGRNIYDLVEEQLGIETIGLLPLYRHEGYMMLFDEKENDVHIYRYRLSLIEQGIERYRSLHTVFVDKEHRSIVNTFEQMKQRLVSNFKELPNPATYLINSKMRFPIQETLLPVAKRLLIREINVNAA
jgi:hypothetical protein